MLKQALKSVNDTVGKFIAGWNALFDYVGKSIKPYTTPSALDIVKAWDESTAVEQGDKISIYNEAQNEPKLEAYAEYIITNDLPATVAYYERTLKRGLEKDLQKALNLDAAGAKELACKIQIQNPFAFEKIKFLISR